MRKEIITGLVLIFVILFIGVLVGEQENIAQQGQRGVTLTEYNRVKGLWEYYSEKSAQLEVQNKNLNTANQQLRDILIEILGPAKKKKKSFPKGLMSGFYEIKGYMRGEDRNKLRRLKKNYPEDAEKTCVVIYSKYKKKDIEFCKKTGYRYMFYDELRDIYEPLIPTWE